MQRACFLLLLSCLSNLPAFAQLLPLQYYSRQDGLVADGVTALCQDSRGYLWIGTGEGLSVCRSLGAATQERAPPTEIES